MNRTTSGLSSFRKYVGYSFRLVIFFSANSIRATFGSIVRVSTGVFERLFIRSVPARVEDTRMCHACTHEPCFPRKDKGCFEGWNDARYEHPDFPEFHFGSRIPGFNIITRTIVENETVEYLTLYFFFFYNESYSQKFPLRIYHAMYIYIISFKNSFSSDLQRVRKSRKSVIQYAFFDAILFDS